MLVVVAVALGGCTSYPPNLVPPVRDADGAPGLHHPALDASYEIGSGDNLLIHSFYHPDLKQPVTVRTDGRVSLLLLGDVMAVGKAPQQLAKELSQEYGKYLDNADVTVTITESAGLSVYVGGQVARSAMIPLKGDLTLLQGITQAGGFLATANKAQVLIVRQTEDGLYRTLQADVEEMLHNRAPEIYLKRHDIVYVPKSAIAQVDQFIDEYINQIIPRSVATVFAYQLPSGPSGGTTIVTPAAP
jgi:protein involved in polysaccharide export with SLBB domain